jgi:predicted RNA-binding protein with PIN domain
VKVLVVDSANVVGSRPDGWWKDRGAATRRLHERLMIADLSHDEVVLVLEGGARGGVRRGRDAHVRVTHASGTGDDAIVAEVTILRKAGHEVTGVTADRMLQARLEGLGAQVVGPNWLLDQLGE